MSEIVTAPQENTEERETAIAQAFVAGELQSMNIEQTREHPLVADMIDSIIDDFAPKEETVKVDLGRGRILEFRRLVDEAVHDELMSEGRGWIKEKADLHRKGHNLGEWLVYGTDNAATLSKVFMLSRLAVDPDLTDLAFLKLARRARPVFIHIFTTVIAGAYRRPSEEELFQAEKKGSKRTPGGSSKTRSQSGTAGKPGKSSTSESKGA